MDSMQQPSLTMNQDLINIYLNPVKWCKTFLIHPLTSKPYAPYDYQELILLDRSMLKILRMGRRAGKTATMILHMLWQCNIRKNITCLVVAPYERQVLEIYDELLKILEASPFLNKATGAYTSTKHPFQIKFMNGARINLMTAGTKSGSEGAATRGQPGDWLYFDEMDYLSDKDIMTVMAIRNRNPQYVGVIGSSTPTGRRGLFYKYCTDKATGFTEFHYTFFDSQVWKTMTEAEQEKTEKEMRAQFPDELTYQHEVLAEFGDEAMGVYNKRHLDRARSYSVDGGLNMIGEPEKNLLWDYYQERRKGYLTNTPIQPQYSTIRTIGVDWDKMGAPTEIVMTEWNPYEVNSQGKQGMFRVVGRFEISRGEFTLTNAVDEIIKLNKVFMPDFIYVDRGYGEAQVELLHKYGIEHPESGLAQKVKPIQLGSKIPVTDPATGKVDEKHVKPFMVNNSIHILDSDLLQLNDEDVLLWRQMENYQITGVSIHGLPTYSKKDEHALDALNLSLLAMTLEFPELSKIIHRFKASNVVLSVKNKDIQLIPAINKATGEVETDPVELRDEKFKNCRNIKWGAKANSISRSGSRKMPSRRQFR
jgi:hypothetical protein